MGSYLHSSSLLAKPNQCSSLPSPNLQFLSECPCNYVCLWRRSSLNTDRGISMTLMWPFSWTTSRVLPSIISSPIDNVASSDPTWSSYIASDITSVVTHIGVSPLTPVFIQAWLNLLSLMFCLWRKHYTRPCALQQMENWYFSCAFGSDNIFFIWPFEKRMFYGWLPVIFKVNTRASNMAFWHSVLTP